MGFPLGSQELANECFRRQDEDPEFQETLKGLTVSVLLVGLDCPGNEDRQLATVIDDGRFLEILVTHKPAPSDLRTAPFDRSKYLFRVSAPQQAFIDMINGTADIIETLKVVKIEGDFSQFMARLAGFMAFLRCLSKMDIEP